MVVNGLKNFFKSLKYFFTPLGTMFLGMMIGFSILLPGIVSSVSSLIDGVNVLYSNINLDFDVLLSNVLDEVNALDWNNVSASLHTLLSAAWLKDMVMQALSTVIGTDLATLQAETTVIMNAFTEQVTMSIVAFIVFWILGFLAGFYLIKFLIRRDIARRSLWKLMLAYFINSLLTTATVVLCMFIFSVWEYSIFISSVLTLLLYGGFALLQAYLLFGHGKINLKNTVNVKNIGLYMLTNVLIFLIAVAFSVLAYLINAVMGIFVGLALLVIAFIVIELNAESYVQSEVKKLTEFPTLAELPPTV